MATIIHADLDAFYASVEQLDDPHLRGRPVVVGGSADGRGVVAAASYEARAFGVRSAMPMARALRLCPAAIRVNPRFERYGECSAAVFGLFRALTPMVEPLSLDEAFLDVSGWVEDGALPRNLAADLKAEVRVRVGLTLSCGVAASKSVAKIASDLRKPDGLVVVPPGAEREFLAPLPVRTLWGVGPKAANRLAQAGVRTIGDLSACADGQATRLLGAHGLSIRDMARGVDDRPVVVERERKSVSAEVTFARDLASGDELRALLRETAEKVSRRLERAGVRASTVAIKVRFADFTTVTRQTTLSAPAHELGAIAAASLRLLDDLDVDGVQLRLIGVQCSNLVDASGTQGVLWAADSSA